jgi:hypothetical protein
LIFSSGYGTVGDPYSVPGEAYIRLVAVVAAFVVVAVSVGSAQTVESTLNLSSLGWGNLDTPRSIETDGDFSTREWLISSADTGLWRVVAERAGGICAGPWFNPLNGANPFGTVLDVQRVGLVHKLLVRTLGQNVVTVIRLDTPGC